MSVILPDICLKWRRLPFSQRNVGRTLPDEWCCAMHPDSNCNRFVRIFILFTFFSPLLLVRLLFLLFRWNESWHSRHDLGESSSGCDVLFTVMISKKKKEWTTWSAWKTDLNSWIAWKTELDLWSNFWTDKNLHGSAFRLRGTRGIVQVFEVTEKFACFCPD